MAGEVATGSIPKPVLRGLHNATIKRNLIVAGVLVTIVTVAFKFLRNEPRKQDYANFYK
jgi:cytochrome c oxidase subunit 6c